MPNIYNVMCLFKEYNESYFNGELPLPRFCLKHSKKTLGQFRCFFDEDDELYDPEIMISDSYEYPEDKLKELLIHEMIHYYLAYTQEDTEITHGKSFKKMANKFNRMYGMNIEKTVDISGMKKIKHGNWFTRLFQ